MSTILEGVENIPDLLINLFSIYKTLKGGSKVGNIDKTVKLTKNYGILKFDNLIKPKES
jgi:hypothetical protein